MLQNNPFFTPPDNIDVISARDISSPASQFFASQPAFRAKIIQEFNISNEALVKIENDLNNIAPINYQTIYNKLVKIKSRLINLPAFVKHFFNDRENDFAIIACCLNQVNYFFNKLPKRYHNATMLYLSCCADSNQLADKLNENIYGLDSIKNYYPIALSAGNLVKIKEFCKLTEAIPLSEVRNAFCNGYDDVYQYLFCHQITFQSAAKKTVTVPHNVDMLFNAPIIEALRTGNIELIKQTLLDANRRGMGEHDSQYIDAAASSGSIAIFEKAKQLWPDFISEDNFHEIPAATAIRSILQAACAAPNKELAKYLLTTENELTKTILGQSLINNPTSFLFPTLAESADANGLLFSLPGFQKIAQSQEAINVIFNSALIGGNRELCEKLMTINLNLLNTITSQQINKIVAQGNVAWLKTLLLAEPTLKRKIDNRSLSTSIESASYEMTAFLLDPHNEFSFSKNFKNELQVSYPLEDNGHIGTIMSLLNAANIVNKIIAKFKAADANRINPEEITQLVMKAGSYAIDYVESTLDYLLKIYKDNPVKMAILNPLTMSNLFHKEDQAVPFKLQTMSK